MANSFTTHYELPKPAHSDAEWDSTLNSALDDIDTLIYTVNTNLASSLPMTGDVTGTTRASVVSSVHATSGTLDGVTIGASQRASGSFSSFFATSGTMDGVVIGGNSPQAGSFSTIRVSGAATFNTSITAPTLNATTQMQTPVIITTAASPASSSDTSVATLVGSIWADDSYLYRRTTAGSIVRIAWATF